MKDPRLLEQLCALVAALFAFYGALLLVSVRSGSSVERNLMLLSTGSLLLLFNATAALTSWSPDSAIARYFGYLVTWPGRALHFLLTGFYIYHVSVVNYGTYDSATLFGQLLTLAALGSVSLGLLLLLLRYCLIQHGRCLVLSTRRPVRFDGVAVCAIIASLGTLLFSGISILPLFARSEYSLEQSMSHFSIFAFTFMAGAAGLLSSLCYSPFVCRHFGFLYHCCGRGVFYYLLGFYQFAQMIASWMSTPVIICEGCSTVSMTTGVVYLTLCCLQRRSQIARIVYVSQEPPRVETPGESGAAFLGT